MRLTEVVERCNANKQLTPFPELELELPSAPQQTGPEV